MEVIPPMTRPEKTTPEEVFVSTDGDLARTFAGIAASDKPLAWKCLAIINAWRADDHCSPFEMACQALETIEALAKAEG
jgi:hypothetical protein